jgi:apolipoprotein N-acyltransferase
VQPLICYEALYPGFTPATAATRPAWVVNVSNDAWFGRTSGPRQHLNLASYRALETGLPVARATPTGVSAMIDPWGRIVEGKRLDPGQAGDHRRASAATGAADAFTAAGAIWGSPSCWL